MMIFVIVQLETWFSQSPVAPEPSPGPLPWPSPTVVVPSESEALFRRLSL